MKKIFHYLTSSYNGFSARTWFAILAIFINSMGSSISIFLAFYLTTQQKMSVESVGLIISSFGIGLFLGAYLGGFLCDKIDSHKVSVAMLIGSGLMAALIPAFSSFIGLLVIILFGGLFYGAFKPANAFNLLHEVSATDRARINGLYRIAINLGMGVASVIGGLLLSIYFPLIFWFDGITSFVAAVLLFCFCNADEINNKNLSEELQGNETILFDKIFMMFCFLLLINCFVFFQIRMTYPIYLNNYYHLNASVFGYLFLLNCVMIVLLEVPLLNAVKEYNSIFIAATGSIFICSSMFMLPFGGSLFFAILSMIILSLGEILLFSTMLTLFFGNASKTYQGRSIGIYQSIFSIASIFAPALGSYIYAKQSSLLWYLCGLIGLLSLLMFWNICLLIKTENNRKLVMKQYNAQC